MNIEKKHYPNKHDFLNQKNKKQFWSESKQISIVILSFILILPMWISMGKTNPLMPYLGNPIIQLILTIFIMFGLGYSFYIKLYKELFINKKLGMYTLIVLSSLTAFIYSLYIMLNLGVNSPNGYIYMFGIFTGYSGDYIAKLIHNDPLVQHNYFDCASAIIVFVLLGNAISTIIKKRAINGLQSLMSLQVKDATLIIGNKQKIINAFDIKIDDLLLVKKGERIPVDGFLVSKKAYIDESLLTGESMYSSKYTNDLLIGQTLNQGEAFIMKATKIGSETIVDNIIKKVQEIQKQKPHLQKIADKISSYFVPIVIVIAFLTFIIYAFILPAFNLSSFKNPYGIAIKTAIAVLIIACPCALGMATPLAIAVGLSRAVKTGVIFSKTEAFEKINKIDIIAFDKTGTITNGKLTITNIFGDQKLIPLAIKIESFSSHPIALAFNKYELYQNKSEDVKLTSYEEIIGVGMKAIYNGHEITISSITSMLSKNYKFSDFELQKNYEMYSNKIITLIGLAINKEIKTIFLLEDQVKSDAFSTIKLLQNQKIDIYMISGDNEEVTKDIALKVGISNYFANIKPIEKADIIKQLQTNNMKVAFVGDGVNDTVALQQADLAIAMQSGSEVAINSSEIIIMKNDILIVYKALILTKRIRINILWNFLWAFMYNIIAILIAILSGWLFLDQIFPFAYIAVIAMILSEITLIVNTIFFKFKKIKY